jgi:hypothetical protein
VRIEVTCQAKIFEKPKKVRWPAAMPIPRVGEQIALNRDDEVYCVEKVEWVPQQNRVIVIAKGFNW